MTPGIKVGLPIIIIVLLVVGGWMMLNRTSNTEPVALTGDSEVTKCNALDNKIDHITCFTKLAKKSRNATICDRASDWGVRGQCKAVIAEFLGDATICENLSMTPPVGYMVDDCTTWDQETQSYICKKVPVDPNDAQELKDACFNDVAKVTQDKSLCEKIILLENFKASCLESIK